MAAAEKGPRPTPGKAVINSPLEATFGKVLILRRDPTGPKRVKSGK